MNCPSIGLHSAVRKRSSYDAESEPAYFTTTSADGEAFGIVIIGTERLSDVRQVACHFRAFR